MLAYNVGRFVTTGFTQIRDALFARVGLHAVRQLAYPTFVHLHDLSLRFHLERRTGGLSRIIERGTTGIENIVRHVILNTAPTVVEFALTAGIVWYQFGFWYVVVIAATVGALCLVHGPRDRLAHHHPPRDERVRYRRAFQGDRLAPELRDGQVFRQRAPRGRAASTAPWRATSAPP